MRIRKWPMVLGAFLALAFGGSVASWAHSSAAASLAIATSTGNGVTDGSAAAVTDMGASVTGLVGKQAQVLQGITLKKITLPTTAHSDRLMVEFWLTTPDRVGRALNNPNSFIKVQLYWPDTDQTAGGASSACTSSRLSIADATTVYVCPDEGERAFKYITARTAGGMLTSSQSGQLVFYVIGQIVVPGGVPAGQQTQLATLSFWTNVAHR